MQTNKITKKVEAALLRKYKTHTEVANQLGITYQRYCQLRNRREKLTRRLKIIVGLLLEE
jgi:transcription initiation factor TFIIIB Brf1 subunit/transcription initiation factor TFIIB